jgi:hypothetical protein
LLGSEEIRMHITDIALECAQECLRVATELPDSPQARRLVQAGLRLLNALIEDAEISVETALRRSVDGLRNLKG